ncbi:MAG TPA: alpha/beta hydrolase [Acetivibrio sp.]|uniref:alpha/beta hydrolase n=1 Tax=Acetivibrio sp. TaxID=1872092 RepID=UPI002C32C055|nr:alpha/beta hydrolase [Acetivibrio sp.]HOM01288.1 alpha/beta hydrolase [Acetivibrio sp.]
MRVTVLTYSRRKSHFIRKIIFYIILLALICSIAVSAVSVFAGWKLIHPKRLNILDFSANIVPSYTDVSFKDITGELTLKGWYFSVTGSNKTVILAHGYGKNRLNFGESTIHLVKSLLDKGYNVLAFDFRNSGESDGNTTTFGVYEKNDLLGAIQYAKGKGSETIVLMGFSTGASTCILAAAESSDVDAVIADSPYSDLDAYFEQNINSLTKLPAIPFNKPTTLATFFLAGIEPDEASPVKAVQAVYPRPMLLIHSKDDTKVPVENSRLIYKAYASYTITFWETGGADHGEIYQSDPKEYIKKVTDFLEKL